MKYLILHGEGMADAPHRDLGGKTPLQAAATPHMDFLARNGELGLASVPTDGLVPGSEVTQVAILGYDPRKYHSGPAPFEAAGLGVALGESDVAFRCTMVTLRPASPPGKGPGAEEIKKLGPHVIMDDATAGGIDTEEARELIDAINEQLGSEAIQFYPGTGHRHLMVWVGGKARATCAAPDEVVGRSIGECLPAGDGSDILRQLMEASLIILRDHPVNEQRREAGLKPANCLWLWGPGRAVRLPKLTERHAITGTIVSSTDLRRGIGICAGLDAVDPAALREAGDADVAKVAEAALRELGKKDLVYVHVEAPHEVTPGGDPKAKIKILEEFDRKVVGPILNNLPKWGAHRVLLCCDRSTGVESPLLYALFEGPVQKESAASRGYSEADAEALQGKVRDTTRLITRLIPEGG